MKTLVKFTIPALLGMMLALPAGVQAQRPGGSSSHRGSVQSAASTRTQSTRTQSTRPGGNSTRPGGSTNSSSSRPNTSVNMGSSLRPSGSIKAEAVRPVQSSRPSTSGTRPGNTRPGNSGNHGNQGSVNNRPNNGGNHGGNHGNHGGTVNRPGNDRPSQNRPGNNKPSYDRPGHNNRPGHGGFRPGYGGSSVSRPGGWASAPRPHYDYRRPGYRPPRPGGGYWGAPRPNPYRINYWVPPVPRYVTVRSTVPTIGTILGLTFGSFIDAGINALYNAGYAINGYYNNAIYLNNVLQFGYTWPEVVVQYDDGLMSGTQFYNWSASPDQNMYYNLYNQMTARYGAPVETSFGNGGQTTTWWAGGNTGYITLSYGYGPSATGMNNYYTSLTYTAY